MKRFNSLDNGYKSIPIPHTSKDGYYIQGNTVYWPTSCYFCTNSSIYDHHKLPKCMCFFVTDI